MYNMRKVGETMYPFVGFAVGLMVGKIFEKSYKAVWYGIFVTV